MSEVELATVSVAPAGRRATFAWRDGKVVPVEDAADRAAVADRIADILARGRVVNRTPYRRLVRLHGQLLIELPVTDEVTGSARTRATVVVLTDRATPAQAARLADQVEAILLAERVVIDNDALTSAVLDGSVRPPRPWRTLALAGAGGMVALLIVGRLIRRINRHRKGQGRRAVAQIERASSASTSAAGDAAGRGRATVALVPPRELG